MDTRSPAPAAVATYDATAAKNRFGQLLEACARGPVAIARHGRVVAWMVSPQALADAPRPLSEQLASRLRATGARYATLFGSLARDEARIDSDIDIAVSYGKPMSADLRVAVTGLVAEIAGRAVDLVDLEAVGGLVLERALGGTELLCEDPTDRQRMLQRLQRSEDDRRSAGRAASAARAALFG